MGYVAIREIGRVRLGVKRVGGGVDSDRAESVVDGVEKDLFALGGHGWILVGAHLGENPGRDED